MLIAAATWFSGRRAALFHVASADVPPYRERFMGQQLRVKTKRRRRAAYLERQKVKAKAATAGAKSSGAKKAKKQAADAQ